jgi:hypothetical protein
MDLSDAEVQQLAEVDRREVDPPIQVEMATWSPAGWLDWWVKERRPRLEWFGRVRGADGRQRWIKASDLRRASGSPSQGAERA